MWTDWTQDLSSTVSGCRDGMNSNRLGGYLYCVITPEHRDSDGSNHNRDVSRTIMCMCTIANMAKTSDAQVEKISTFSQTYHTSNFSL